MENTSTNLPAAANSTAILFNRIETIGIGIHGTIGGVSALATLLLLFHLLMVAAVRRGDDSKVNGEKVFVLTRLGAYFACLLISDLLISFGQFIQALWASTGGINEGPLCTTQAIMIQIGGYGTAVFSSVIAIHTFSVIVLQKTSPKFFAICVIVLGWAIPIGVDLIATFSRPRATPFYGLDHYWCWIRPEYPMLRAVLHYLPILLSAFISVICYSLVFLVVRGNLHIDGGRVTLRRGWRGQMQSSEDYRDMLSVLANRMLWYPISYIVLIIPMTIVQLLIATHHTMPFAAWVVAGIALASLGFVNVMIYCITRVVLGRPPTPTTWDMASQSTFVARSPSSAKGRFSEYLPDPGKFSTSLFPGYGRRGSVVPSYMGQPPQPSHHSHPAAAHPVVQTLPRNSLPQQMYPHRRDNSEATIVAQRAYGHSSRNASYSSTESSPTVARKSLVPGRIITPELLQQPITPSSVLALEMENPQSMMSNQHQHNASRMTNDDALSMRGSLAPPPRPVASRSPSTNIGYQSERGFRGTEGEQSIEGLHPGLRKGPSRDASLSAVLDPQDAAVVPPPPIQLAQKSPYTPKGPFIAGHHRTGSRPGFL